MSQAVDRREFLRRSAALGLGAAAGPLAGTAPAHADEAPRIRKTVTLGRTGLRIGDIGFGASRLEGDEATVRHALERGVTYFDTAEGYTRGASETTLGKALEGRRDEVVLVSKTHGGANDRAADLMASLEGSLRRLRTDRVEVFFNHAVNDVRRLQNDEWASFATRAKEQGKIRFTGMSGHGGQLVPCLDHALGEDLVDVILVGFNFGQDPSFLQKFTGRLDFIAVQPELPRVLRRAKEKGVGVVAMKTLRGARLNDMRPYEGAGATFAQAALRWTLAHPDVDAAIITMRDPAAVDEFLGASGWEAPHQADAGLLSRYARRAETSQCRYGCDACASSCPAGVEIPEVLRTRMYAEDYGDPALGREDYAKIRVNAASCTGCAAPCLDACPHGVAIPELTRRAHGQLASGQAPRP
jgi:predicted aldo/keto reductase-like oxidoreductase